MKTVRITAEELWAGDKLEVKQGSIRKYYALCEVHVRYDAFVGVTVVYIDHGQFVRKTFGLDDKVRVRE